MPAAAVIPAPIAYTKVVAVKKLVVGFLVVGPGPPREGCRARGLQPFSERKPGWPSLVLVRHPWVIFN